MKVREVVENNSATKICIMTDKGEGIFCCAVGIITTTRTMQKCVQLLAHVMLWDFQTIVAIRCLCW